MLLLRLLPLLATTLGAPLLQETPGQRCGLSRYRFLPPQELRAVKRMKEQFEDIMLLSDHRCHTKLFYRKWNPAELSVPDRVMLAEAELDLAISMLELPAAPTFAETRQRPLDFLAQAQEDLRSCMATEAPHQPSRRLRNWLQKLQTAKETETTSCLEASVILYIFKVLNDLQCAALGEQCS
ncbi:interferon lambda-3-like [Calypte anna]|uniref:interferon lambda-3-like n=1 Tax=Calypte anna TaxID=9244 RepID=UPI0004C1155D|nr:interferon lambda-3-like [Calypte anna]